MSLNDVSPLVSIIMPAYNAEYTVEASMASIINQTYKNWELLVLDDGSNDQTLAKAGKCIDKRIRVYRDKKRIGIAERLNQGLLLCNGKYIARMDADDISFPTRIEKQVNYMEDHPEIDLIGTSIILVNKSNRYLSKHICPSIHNELVGTLNSGIPLYHPTWLGKKEWFLKWRYKKVYFKYGAEDFDLLLRSFKSSLFGCLKEPLLAHRYTFSIRKITVNTLLMILLLAKNKYWKDSFLMMIKFPLRTMLNFLHIKLKSL